MTTYGNLVRHRIPELIRAEGRQPVVEVLRADQRRRALIDELLEEAAGTAEADPGDFPELADVLEVVRALAVEYGGDLDVVLALADRKRAARGGFAEGLFIVEVD